MADNSIFAVAVLSALIGTGDAEVCHYEDGRFQLELGVFPQSAHQLVVYGMRYMLRSRIAAVDIHSETLSVQYSLSDDKSLLRIRNVLGHNIFPRRGSAYSLDRRAADYGRMLFNCKIEDYEEGYKESVAVTGDVLHFGSVVCAG